MENRLVFLIALGVATAACVAEPVASDDDDDGGGAVSGSTTTGQGGSSSDGGSGGAGLGGGEGGGEAGGPPAWQCNPSDTFSAPVPYAPLADRDVSEPWISGDGLTLVVTSSIPNFKLELAVGTRATRDDDFATLEPVDDGLDTASQGGLSTDGTVLWLVAEGDIQSSQSMGGVFAPPNAVGFELASGTQYPEYPREADGLLYYSARESNWRRSIYAHDLGSGTTTPVFFDVGDIFTYAISSNGRYLLMTMSATNGLETYYAERQDASSSFPTPQLLPEFGSEIAATGITDDGCEVFGYDWDAYEGEAGVYHTLRGQ